MIDEQENIVRKECFFIETKPNEYVNDNREILECDDSEPIGIVQDCLAQGHSGDETRQYFYNLLTMVAPGVRYVMKD
jgi:hypothetical protein